GTLRGEAEGMHRRMAPRIGMKTRSNSLFGTRQHFSDSIRRVSIPERRHSRLCVARRPRERDGGGVKDLDGIVAGDLVRSYFKGNRTLSVFAQSDAGNSQDRGLFLNPAGIGKHQARARQELKKIKI